MQMTEQLKEETYKAVKEIEAKHVGIAFSGGIDSSLLAKVCKDIGKNVTLLTIGFSSRRDIEISNQVSKVLGLPLLEKTIALDELEHSLKTVLSVIEFHRIVRLENCVCFYHVFKSASMHEIQTVLSANGADELFCGYHVYTRQFTTNRKKMINLMKNLVKTAKKDKEQTDKISKMFGIKYRCPFLSKNFVEFAMKIPLHLKIKSKEDKIRKQVLREVALKVGVPRYAALRPKKAFQYSSGVHKAIRRLAKKKGFTKTKAKKASYHSEMEAYIENLKRIADHGTPHPQQ